MSRIVQTTVYKFDELSDDAKEKAREWYREACQYDDWWSEHMLEDFVTIAKILGIEIKQRSIKGTHPAIYYSGFSNQGDGACFEGHYSYAKGCAKAIRKHAPKDTELHRIADALTALQRRYSYALEATVKHRDHYYHSGCMEFTVTAERDRLPPLTEDAEEALPQLLRDFADWVYLQLEKEYEWQNANEQVDENIRANEYEFEEDGSIAAYA